MDALGLVAYGFERAEAEAVRLAVEEAAGAEVLLFGAAGREGSTLMELLESGPGGEFGAADTRVLVFVGFDDPQLDAAIKSYPKGLRRPIFAVLTESNAGWPLALLLQELLKEDRCFAERGKKGAHG